MNYLEVNKMNPDKIKKAIYNAMQRVGTHSARRCGNQILKDLFGENNEM